MARLSLDQLKEKLARTRIDQVLSDRTFAATADRSRRVYSTTCCGMKVMVEHPRGTTRKGTDRRGKKWSSTMRNDYGYFPRTKGADGEGIDVFLGPVTHPTEVYVVHTKDPYTDKYDEDKVVLGARSMSHAKDIFLSNYDSPKHYRSCTAIPFATFKRMMSGGEVGGVRWTRKHRRAHDANALFSASGPVHDFGVGDTGAGGKDRDMAMKRDESEMSSPAPKEEKSSTYGQGKNPASHHMAPPGMGGGGSAPQTGVAGQSGAAQGQMVQQMTMPAADKPSDAHSPFYDKQTGAPAQTDPHQSHSLPAHHQTSEDYIRSQGGAQGDPHEDERLKQEHREKTLQAIHRGEFPGGLPGHHAGDDEFARAHAEWHVNHTAMNDERAAKQKADERAARAQMAPYSMPGGPIQQPDAPMIPQAQPETPVDRHAGTKQIRGATAMANAAAGSQPEAPVDPRATPETPIPAGQQAVGGQAGKSGGGTGGPEGQPGRQLIDAARPATPVPAGQQVEWPVPRAGEVNPHRTALRDSPSAQVPTPTGRTKGMTQEMARLMGQLEQKKAKPASAAIKALGQKIEQNRLPAASRTKLPDKPEPEAYDVRGGVKPGAYDVKGQPAPQTTPAATPQPQPAEKPAEAPKPVAQTPAPQQPAEGKKPTSVTEWLNEGRDNDTPAQNAARPTEAKPQPAPSPAQPAPASPPAPKSPEEYTRGANGEINEPDLMQKVGEHDLIHGDKVTAQMKNGSLAHGRMSRSNEPDSDQLLLDHEAGGTHSVPKQEVAAMYRHHESVKDMAGRMNEADAEHKAIEQKNSELRQKLTGVDDPKAKKILEDSEQEYYRSLARKDKLSRQYNVALAKHRQSTMTPEQQKAETAKAKAEQDAYARQMGMAPVSFNKTPRRSPNRMAVDANQQQETNAESNDDTGAYPVLGRGDSQSPPASPDDRGTPGQAGGYRQTLGEPEVQQRTVGRHALLKSLSDAGVVSKGDDGSYVLSRYGGAVRIHENKPIPRDDDAWAASVTKYAGQTFHGPSGATFRVPMDQQQIREELNDPEKRKQYEETFAPVAYYSPKTEKTWWPQVYLSPEAKPEHVLEEISHHAFQREISHSDKSRLLEAVRWHGPDGARGTVEEAEEAIASMVSGDGSRGQGAKTRTAMDNWSPEVKAAYERLWDSVHHQSSPAGYHDREKGVEDPAAGSAGGRYALMPRSAWASAAPHLADPKAPVQKSTPTDDEAVQRMAEVLHGSLPNKKVNPKITKEAIDHLIRSSGRKLDPAAVEKAFNEHRAKANEPGVINPEAGAVAPGTPNIPHGDIERAVYEKFVNSPTKDAQGQELPGPQANELATIPGAPQKRTGWKTLDWKDAVGISPEKRMATAVKALKEKGAVEGRDYKVDGRRQLSVNREWLDKDTAPVDYAKLRDTAKEALRSYDNFKWYPEVAEHMEKLVGKQNMHEAGVILAITSPQKAFELNMSEALTVMKSVRDLRTSLKGKEPSDHQLFTAIRNAKRPGRQAGGEAGLGITGDQIREMVHFYKTGNRDSRYKTTTYATQAADSATPGKDYDPNGVMDVHMMRIHGHRAREISPETGELIDGVGSPRTDAQSRYLNYINSKLAGDLGVQGNQAQAAMWLWGKHNLGGRPDSPVPWHLAKTDESGQPVKIADPETGKERYQWDEKLHAQGVQPGTIASYKEMARKTGEEAAYAGIKNHPFVAPQGVQKAGGVKSLLRPDAKGKKVPTKVEDPDSPVYSREAVAEARERAARGAHGAVMGGDADPNVWTPPEGRVADTKEALRLHKHITRAMLDKDGKVGFLRALGIPHEVTQGLGSYGGQEGNFTIRPLGATHGDASLAHFVGALYGKYGHQAAYIADHPNFDEPTTQGLAVHRDDGRKMTPAEVSKVHKVVNPEASVDGDNFSMADDGTALKYLHQNWNDKVGTPEYDKGFKGWATAFQDKLAKSGLKGYNLATVQGKTDYVPSEEYGHELAQHADHPDVAKHYAGEKISEGRIGRTGHTASPARALAVQAAAVRHLFEPATEAYLRNGYTFDPKQWAERRGVPASDMKRLIEPALQRIAQKVPVINDGGKWRAARKGETPHQFDSPAIAKLRGKIKSGRSVDSIAGKIGQVREKRRAATPSPRESDADDTNLKIPDRPDDDVPFADIGSRKKTNVRDVLGLSSDEPADASASGSSMKNEAGSEKKLSLDDVKKKNFRHWFGDSKVVDEKGKPVVAYHGTSKGGWDAFDPQKTEDGNLYGPGFYFTEDKGIADSYRDGKGVTTYPSTAKSWIVPEKDRKEFFDRVYAKREGDIGRDPSFDPTHRTVLQQYKSRFDDFLKNGSVYKLLKQDHWKNNPIEQWQISDAREAMSRVGIQANPNGETKAVHLAIRNPKRISEEYATKKDYEEMRKFFKKNPQPGGWDAFHIKKLRESLDDQHLKASGVRASLFNEHSDPKWENLLKMSVAFKRKGDPRFTEDPSDPMQTGEPKLRWDALMYMLSDGANYDKPRRAMTDYLKSKGHDGISHVGGGLVSPGSKQHKVWIAFHPNQVKSVDNKGTWSPDTDNMIHAEQQPKMFDGRPPDDTIAGAHVRYMGLAPQFGVDDKGAMNYSDNYIDVGHSPESNSRNVVWMNNGSGLLHEMSEKGVEPRTHDEVFGGTSDNAITGRYELDAGRLSIMPPNSGWRRPVPEGKVRSIVAQFNDMAKQHGGKPVSEVRVFAPSPLHAGDEGPQDAPTPAEPKRYAHASEDVVKAHADLLNDYKQWQATNPHIQMLNETGDKLQKLLDARAQTPIGSEDDNRMFKEIESLSDARTAAHRAIEKGYHKSERARLKSLAHPKGPGKLSPHPLSNQTLIRGKNVKDALEIINSIAGHHPEAGEHVIFKVPSKRGGRECADVVKRDNPTTGQLETHNFVVARPGSTAAVVAHEIGHILELRNPEIFKEAVAFRESRRNGEEWKPHSELTGNPKGDKQLAFKDEWLNSYTSKHYGHLKATEVVSTGIEHLVRNPGLFAEKDPEHFQFILHILRKYGGA